jgi:hypothetical protein
MASEYTTCYPTPPLPSWGGSASNIGSWLDEMPNPTITFSQPWEGTECNIDFRGVYPDALSHISGEASTPPDDSRLHEVYTLPMPQMDSRGRRGAISAPSGCFPFIRELEDTKEYTEELGIPCFQEDTASECDAKSDSVTAKVRYPLPFRSKISMAIQQEIPTAPGVQRTPDVQLPQKKMKELKLRKVKTAKESPKGVASKNLGCSVTVKGHHNEAIPWIESRKLGILLDAEEIKVRTNSKTKSTTGCNTCK